MSADEDTELRDLVAQTLENTGVLGKIRAELRASVFLALEEQDAVQNKTPFVNQELNKFTGSKEGFLASSLVREFLEYFNLDFSAAVFNPEANFTDKYEGRDNLARALNIVESDKTKHKPLLCELMKRVEDTTDKIGRQRTNPQIEQVAGQIQKDLTSKQIADAKQKFQYYDKDHNGTIDKAELRGLFMDIFPHFHKNMLERYVNDEFQAEDRDFSSGIEFDEFLGMYRRLFVLCRSVVSHDVSDIIPHKLPARTESGGNKPSPLESLGQQEKTQEQEADNVKGQRSMSAASDYSDDNFFDDPLPKSGKGTGFSKAKQDSPPTTPTKKNTPAGTSGMSSLSNMPPLGGSTLGSLAGAPPLSGQGQSKVPKSPDWKDLDALDDKIDKLSFDISKSEDDDGGDDYEDDFQSSPGSQSQSQTQSQSHRSRKSSKSGDSISEEIIEDIDISGDDDFLASSQDKMDDITTDRSLSQISQNGTFDYMEDAQVGS